MGMPKYVLMTVQTEKIVEKWEIQSMENMQSIQIGKKHCVPKFTFPRFLWEGLFVQRSGFGN